MPVALWLAGRLCQSCLHAYDEDSNGRCSVAEQHLFPKVFQVNNLIQVRFPREMLCNLKPSYRSPCSKINTQLYEEKSGVTRLFNTYLLNTHCIQHTAQNELREVPAPKGLVFFWEVGRACGTWSQTFLNLYIAIASLTMPCPHFCLWRLRSLFVKWDQREIQD